MVGSKAPWVKVEGGADDPRFENYPDVSLAEWHQAKGLSSPQAAGSAAPGSPLTQSLETRSSSLLNRFTTAGS